jgi:hypothetical protein
MKDPTLPIDKAEPLDQRERNESSERQDHFELFTGTDSPVVVPEDHEE